MTQKHHTVGLYKQMQEGLAIIPLNKNSPKHYANFIIAQGAVCTNQPYVPLKVLTFSPSWTTGLAH